MRRWDSLVDRYVKEYESRGLAEGTVEKARRELERFGLWLKSRRPRPRLEDVGVDAITRYIAGRMAFRAKVTVYGCVSILRCFGEFLLRDGVWRENPLRWMEGPKIDGRSRIPRRISKDVLVKLWEGAAASRRGYSRSLWVAVLGLLYGTGLRRGELERLDLSDWSSEEGVVLIDGRKTGQERRVAVPELAWRCVESYLPHRHNVLERVGNVGEKALFVTQKGQRLKGNAVGLSIQRIAKRCGLPRITMHMFRHSCASDLLESGVNLPEVQKILGHTSISSTIRYVHVADPQRHAAVALHPLNEILGLEASA